MLVVDRAEIEATIEMASMAVAIEEAYVAASAGEIELPPVGHLTFPAVDGDCHIKFGHRRGATDFVIKVATGFPHQAVTGAATGNGLSLVLSAETGQVQAVLHDEMVLTDVRTGIGGAIATRLLARPEASRLLIVGTGIQARRQIEAHVQLLDRRLAIEVWGRSAGAAARVVDDIVSIIDDGDVDAISVADELDAACRDAEIIVTATAAADPIISTDWITPGTHITAVGADAPGKSELDPRLIRRADRLAADLRSQCLDHGELAVVADDAALASEVVEIGELLSGRPGRSGSQEITIADLTGIAAQDIAAAGWILDALG